MSGIIIGGFILLTVIVRNLAILGLAMDENANFPSYTAARIIEMGDSLTRMEGVITMNFVLAGITKTTVCLIASTQGMAKLFNIKNYKDLVWPVALLTLMLSAILYTNATEMFTFMNNYYAFYAIPFQIVIPLIVWIAAEIKNKKKEAMA
jgi:spore germination protein KB